MKLDIFLYITCSLLICVAQPIIRTPKSIINTAKKAMKPKCSCSLGLSVNYTYLQVTFHLSDIQIYYINTSKSCNSKQYFLHLFN